MAANGHDFIQATISKMILPPYGGLIPRAPVALRTSVHADLDVASLCYDNSSPGAAVAQLGASTALSNAFLIAVRVSAALETGVL